MPRNESFNIGHRRSIPFPSCRTQSTSGMTRRDFAGLVSVLGALGCLDPQFVTRALAESPRRLSWMANRTAGAEGRWQLSEVEGRVPTDLAGTLFRIAPGQSENHGTELQHLFDGDPFVSAFKIEDGKVSLRAGFVPTPERQAELEAGEMLYAEFGTLPPAARVEAATGSQEPARPMERVLFKNQPNVNVIAWDGRLLGLSEGGHPTAIDPETFAFQGRWDFHGTLPPYIPFTAHPKHDPTTGETYGYGIAQGPGFSLTVFKMKPDGTLETLHSVPQSRYFMIHDMLLTKNHIVFVIPPVSFDLPVLLAGKTNVADALRYLEQEPTRFLVLRRDGTGEPQVFEQPANMVFHNGNAFERERLLVVDTILTRDDSVLELLHSFANDKLPPADEPRLTRLELDLESGQVASRTELENDQEFPRFNTRHVGQDARYLYTMESTIPDDQFALTALVRHDLHKKSADRVEAGSGRAFGETVFVARQSAKDEVDGWLLVQGYDAPRDENFLEIRDAETLDFAARVWTGNHFPLGFHGNWVAKDAPALAEAAGP